FEEEYGDPSKIDDLEQLCRLKRSPFYPFNVPKTIDRLYHSVYCKELDSCLKSQQPPKDGHIQVSEYVIDMCQRLLLFRSSHSSEPLFGTKTQVETDTLEKNKDMPQFNLSHSNEKDQHDAMYALDKTDKDKARAKDIEKAGAIGIGTGTGTGIGVGEDDDDMNLTRKSQIKEEDEIGGDGDGDDDLDLARSHSEAPEKRRAEIQKQREEKKKSVLEFKPKALERR
ncbi:hypothetical protein RFI_38565, partial [Reticulomyxa filosa]